MRIDEFEFQDRNGNEIEPTKNQLVIYIKSLHKEIKELKQQLTITEKALELACDNLEDINFKLYNTEVNFVDYFKQQAKEMLENE